jgi:putative phosphoesterase
MYLSCLDAARVAIVADTHGHLDARIADVVAACDCAVHAGDVGNAGVLAELQPGMKTVIAVLGNNDVAEKWPPDERGALSALPVEARLELNGGQLVVVHGHKAGAVKGRHAWLRKHYPEARGVVYGHSHRLVCDQTDSPWIMNPGGAGMARTCGGPSCLVLSVDGGDWSVETIRFAPLPATVRRRAATQGHRTT